MKTLIAAKASLFSVSILVIKWNVYKPQRSIFKSLHQSVRGCQFIFVMDGGGLPSGHWQRTLCFRSNQTSLSKMKTDPCAAYRKPSGTLTCHLPCVCGRCPAGYSCRSFRTCLLENVDMAFTKFQTQSVFVGLVLKYTMRWLQAA